MRACIRVSIDCEGGITVTTKTMKTTREFGTVLDFKEKMEKVDFYVQEGRFDELNAIELASQGKLISCFGNNAG